MERSEPTFVPEWYKGSNSSAASSGNSNHQSGFSLLSATVVHNNSFSSRSRLSASINDYDASRSSSFSERTSSSFRRSYSGNGYIVRDKDVSSRTYNSFGRSYRDRDREKDLEIHDRDNPLLVDNGFGDYPDTLIQNKSEKDLLRHSQSMLAGRRADPWLKRTGHDSGITIQPVGGRGRSSGIIKSSFEREFPSLGAEEKLAGSDIARVSSPGLNTAIHNLPVTASTLIGADGWTSALAEVPIVGDDGSIVLTALQTNSTLTSTASSIPTGLNMAETVAQAPARTRTAPQLPNDSQKIEELHRQQILKLRPVTPSIPKNLGASQSEKSKTKGPKLAEYSSAKMGQHPSSQFANHLVRPGAKPEALMKSHQSGKYRVLNRERSGVSPTGKESLHSRNGSRVAASTGLHVKGGSAPSASFGEKKASSSQAQNRNDFFNALRKKMSSNHENANHGPHSSMLAPSFEKPDEEVPVDALSVEKNGASSSSSASQCPAENGSCSLSSKAAEESERLVPDEEEAAFLRSLGWEENAGEDILTPEEIESFLTEYKKRKPVSKLRMKTNRPSSSSEAETNEETSIIC